VLYCVSEPMEGLSLEAAATDLSSKIFGMDPHWAFH
jgi:hypothetical protein